MKNRIFNSVYEFQIKRNEYQIPFLFLFYRYLIQNSDSQAQISRKEYPDKIWQE